MGDIRGFLSNAGAQLGPQETEQRRQRDKITKPEKRQPAVAARRAQAALRLHGIRRTKDSLIDGRPILQLPEKSIIVHECQLDDAERMIYNAIEQRAAVRLNRYIKVNHETARVILKANIKISRREQ